MALVEYVIGAAIGAGGMLVKDVVVGNKATESLLKLQRENSSLSDEVEKLKRRYKEAEGQIEDLTAENQRLIRKNKDNSDVHDELEDERDLLKSKIKRLQSTNEELERKLQEYRIACESLQNENTMLKSKQ